MEHDHDTTHEPAAVEPPQPDDETPDLLTTLADQLAAAGWKVKTTPWKQATGVRASPVVASPERTGLPRPRCYCGKTVFRTEQKAADVVLQSKMKRALRGKTHRKEARVYPCPGDPGVWHVTKEK